MARLIILFLALVVSLEAVAEVYKWTDADGKTHFADQKPNTNKMETLVLPTSPKSESTPTPPIDDNGVAGRTKLLKILSEEREIKQKKAAEQAQQQAKTMQLCGQARDYYNNISSGTLYNVNAKGERTYLNDREREQEIKNTQNFIKQRCR